MKKTAFLLTLTIFFAGCSFNDIRSVTQAAISKDPTAAFKILAQSKAIQYGTNPKALTADIKAFEKFIKNFKDIIEGNWGEDNVKIPKRKEYVKYMQNFKSRALIDFDKGLITVETLDEKETKKSLNSAIVSTLLLPEDPRAADLYSSKEVKLGGKPYLLGEVKDDQNKDIRYMWRANRYANLLIKNQFKQRPLKKDGKYQKVSYVQIPMVKDHASVRVKKFKPFVQQFAKKYELSENLVYAIIRTESNFNQFAVSHAGALGLMQVVPSSAGKDAYKFAKGKSWQPSRNYLFNAKNNIELGSAYLKILYSKYLPNITNPISHEYCVISAYNTGSGNVLKTFNSNRSKAQTIINSKTPAEVYTQLREKLPYEETRRYLYKVVEFKKDYVGL